MKRNLILLTLIVIVALTLSTFVGCDNRPHAYLVEGVYECENISYGEKNIDKITLGIKEITGSEYYVYDPHITERAEKVYYIDFDIWIDGEQIEVEYRTYYEFDLRYFTLSFSDDDDETIGFDFVTKKDNENGYYVSAESWKYSQSLLWRQPVLEEIILKKV
ncbi:MAG: hypothetical protein HDT32_05980 [Clostridiales bacterium]|nr:hypothetical protein [Clostridiales bacterium]